MYSRIEVPFAVRKMQRPFLDHDHDVPEGYWYLQRVGEGDPIVIPLTMDSTVIGYENLLKNGKKGKHVSPQHAVLKIIKDYNVVMVLDKHSEYGIFVNSIKVPAEGQILRKNSILCLGCKYPKSHKYYGFIIRYKEKTLGSTSDSFTDDDRSDRGSISDADCTVLPESCSSFVTPRKSYDIFAREAVPMKRKVPEDKTDHNLENTNEELRAISRQVAAWSNEAFSIPPAGVQRQSPGTSMLRKIAKPKTTVKPVTYVHKYNQKSFQNVASEKLTSDKTNNSPGLTGKAAISKARTGKLFPYPETLRPHNTSGAKLLQFDTLSKMGNPELKKFAPSYKIPKKKKVEFLT